MTREKLLNILSSVLLVASAAQFAGIYLHLYTRVIWFDHIAHFLGGVFAALLVLWVLFFSGYLRFTLPSSRLALFVVMVGGALIIGVGWEVFENLLGLTWSPKGYWLDTELDLLFDAVGALCVYYSVRNRL